METVLKDPTSTFEEFLEWLVQLPGRFGRGLQWALIAIYRMLRAFSQRAYWYRVWIVQEICSASNAQILCGDSSLTWKSFKLFAEQFSRFSGYALIDRIDFKPLFPQNPNLPGLAQELSISPMNALVFDYAHFSSGKGLCISKFLEDFELSQSSNHLDRIYGFLGLIDRPKEVRQQISTDYRRTTLQLAWIVLDFMGREHYNYIEDCRRLIVALDVTKSPGMRLSIRDRQIDSRRRYAAANLSPYLCVKTDSLLKESRSYIEDRRLSENDTEHHQIGTWDALATININIEGYLSAEDSLSCVVPTQWDTAEDASFVEKVAICVSRSPQHEAPRPSILWVKSEAVAFVCPQAQSGDILISRRDELVSGLGPVSECEGFVVRHYKSDVYRVVGYAIINTNLRFHRRSSFPHDLPVGSRTRIGMFDLQKDIDVVFDLYFDKEDWLVYVSNLVQDIEFIQWPGRLSTSITRQDLSSFAVMRGWWTGTPMTKPSLCRDQPGKRYEKLSSSDIEIGETWSGPLRDMTSKRSPLRRVASVGSRLTGGSVPKIMLYNPYVEECSRKGVPEPEKPDRSFVGKPKKLDWYMVRKG